MVKEEITTTKYLIHSQIKANGFVEKPDIVGAIFGQTEGLLSDSLDLRELQKTGKIGRLKVDMTNKSGRTSGEVIIPSSLDRIETTILAASLETINRVGPCEAKLTVSNIEDVRSLKRKTIVARAKELYQEMMEEFTPESTRMIDEVKESIRVHEIIEYGEEKLPAGPNVPESDAILIVEGRSDVLNLLKFGIKNTIAVEGVSVPKTVADLTEEKTVTAFLDGDRGGDLILKELLQIGKIDYITRAPRGQEVEYLNKDQVLLALKNKTPVEKITNHTQYQPKSQHYHNHNHHQQKNKQNTEHNINIDSSIKPTRKQKQIPQPAQKITTTTDHNKMLKKILDDLSGTNKGEILDHAMNVIKTVQVENIYNEIKDIDQEIYAIVFDGIISQRILDLAKEKNLERIVAVKMNDIVKKPETIKIMVK
ncbi:MAG: DNA primase DnaG [Methanobacteriaceae archaeon]|nr:DNA primase DnaG [Methanobacteriaceae archaeon]